MSQEVCAHLEAIASQGVGVMDTLRVVVHGLLEPLRQEYEGSGDRYPVASGSGNWPRRER